MSGLSFKLMRSCLYIFVALFFNIACQHSSINTTTVSNNISVRIKNLPIDSCSIRVHHIITGREVFHLDKFALLDSLIISDIEDDMYIIVISWPKTYISHQVYTNKGFDKERDNDYFELTKPFYFNKRNGNNYVIEVVNNVSQEDLERNGAQVLKFRNVACSECDLADDFWDLYTAFYSRKMKLLDSLKLDYYSSVDNLKLQRSKELYNEIEKLKVSFVHDDLLDNAIIQKITGNEKSSISTFFLFYQLYNHRDFPRFKNSFLSLSEDAKRTKYYKMLENQYQ